MKNVKVIKANTDRVIRNNSLKIDKLRVAPYCRVSTGFEEQKNSYESQREYYKELINKKDEWELVDIYADEAISGTQVLKRTDFQRMINDAVEGKIDLIITKSISRFARNTLDTLKYVRLLKEKNVGIIFEKENINTLTMNGEILLVILSSIAQQESESIAGNVKMGLKMKMSRGEMVGFNRCLGYHYDKKNKVLSIIPEEAEIVRYIFNRYTQGAGSFTIAKELTNLGYTTIKGNLVWGESAIRAILNNEKYKGDLLLGKTFTLDPISHKRLSNMGESEKYYVEDNHEPIVSKEIWDEAQKIKNKRSINENNNNRRNYCRKHSFSSMIKCGCCNSSYIRRTWHNGSKNEKNIWTCAGAVKKGKNHCRESESIQEEILEKAFVEAYSLILKNNEKIITNLLKTMEEIITNEDGVNILKEKEIEREKIKQKLDRLLDLKLEENIDEEIYNKKKSNFTSQLLKIDDELLKLKEIYNDNNDYKVRIKKLKERFTNLDKITEFDREVFECVVEKIIIGCYNDNGQINGDKITFVLKSGEEIKGTIKTTKKDKNVDDLDVKKKENNVCSHSSYDIKGMCSYSANNSCRVCDITTSQKVVEILDFNHFSRFYRFA